MRAYCSDGAGDPGGGWVDGGDGGGGGGGGRCRAGTGRAGLVGLGLITERQQKDVGEGEVGLY